MCSGLRSLLELGFTSVGFKKKQESEYPGICTEQSHDILTLENFCSHWRRLYPGIFTYIFLYLLVYSHDILPLLV
jgi:hypothetical protein